jgi:predicted dehydrogenase/threonine dehydrogenase-like Zn-dependent dehydrogenase
MKQVLQNLRTGKTSVVEVPVPQPGHGQLLVRTTQTLISAGTERMLVDYGKANWIDKARQQPDKVRQVLQKIKTDGLKPTIEAVSHKLDQPLPMGYCNVGRIARCGAAVHGFEAGDRVASNGKHAEYALVPVHLCARIPEAVSDEEAAFTVLGAIALQGIRLVEPTLGEVVVVSGLGLIGLMAVQLLRANGCKVLGLDFDPARLELARRFGAETIDLSAGADPVATAQAVSQGRGVDAVIVSASTKSSEPIKQAALMCRKRGRIVLVGVTGLELSRADFYEKELTFQVSCSYGPGRYDPSYEQQGNDYPIGFVRWTEQRNFEAVLELMASGSLDVKPLVSHRFAIAAAEDAYTLVASREPSLAILLAYPQQDDLPLQHSIRLAEAPLPAAGSNQPRLSFIGAGNYATGTLIPAFREAGARLQSIVSNEGVSGAHAGRKFGFAEASTEAGKVIASERTDAVVISTRHDCHADLVIQAIEAGKPAFVEKPLCLTEEQQRRIEAALAAQVTQNGVAPLLMVGFNRRFAPLTRKMKSLLEAAPGPKSFIVTVNAGAIPPEHWVQDLERGGGRIIGEACHFIDLLRFLAGARIVGWHRSAMASRCGDTASIDLSFADGSIGTVHYFANGSRGFPKERIEVFAGGRTLQLDNFRSLQGFGWAGFSRMKSRRQDKGQRACAEAFLRALRGEGPRPIPTEVIFEVSRVCIAVAAGEPPTMPAGGALNEA